MFDAFRTPCWGGLSRGAALSLGIRVVGTGLLYGLHVALARWLGSGEYGTYVFAISWTSVLAQFGKMGLPSAALRFVPAYHTNDERAGLYGFLSTGRRLVLAGTSGLAALGIAVVLLVPTGPWPLTALLLGIALAPLMGLFSFETEVLRALNRYGEAYAPNYVLRPLAIGGGTGGLLWAGGVGTAESVLLWTGGVFVLLILLQQWGVRRALPARPAALQRTPWHWLRVAGPLLLVSGFQLILRKTDLFLIGMLVGAEEVGVYFAAMRTAQVVTFVSFAVDAVAAPEIARRYHRDDAPLQATVSRLAHWYFWPTLGTAGGVALLGAPILSLFGTAFTAGAPLMLVLMGALVVGAAMGPQLYLLSLTGHERSSALIFGVCSLGNVGLNLVGITLYGPMGAALATATTLVVRSLWVRRRVVRRTGIRPSIWAALRLHSPRS
jgi:O-antigen/teichoic acid export membrane protein